MDEIEYLGATSTIQSYNLFTYCEGNPVNMVDESGTVPISVNKFFVEETAVVSTAVATAVAVISTVAVTVVASVAAAYVGVSMLKTLKKAISVYHQIINKVKEYTYTLKNKKANRKSNKYSFTVDWVALCGKMALDEGPALRDFVLNPVQKIITKAMEVYNAGCTPKIALVGYGLEFDQKMLDDITDIGSPWR